MTISSGKVVIWCSFQEQLDLGSLSNLVLSVIASPSHESKYKDSQGARACRKVCLAVPDCALRCPTGSKMPLISSSFCGPITDLVRQVHFNSKVFIFDLYFFVYQDSSWLFLSMNMFTVLSLSPSVSVPVLSCKVATVTSKLKAFLILCTLTCSKLSTYIFFNIASLSRVSVSCIVSHFMHVYCSHFMCAPIL